MAVHNIQSLLAHQIEKDRLSHIPQVSRYNPTVIFRFSSKIFHVAKDRICCRRSHTRAHILRILQSIIYDFPNRHSTDPHMAFSSSYKESTAPRHRPLCRQRSLIGISQRKTEFLFRAPEMAGCHRQHILPISCRHTHGCQCQRFPRSGAGAKQPK